MFKRIVLSYLLLGLVVLPAAVEKDTRPQVIPNEAEELFEGVYFLQEVIDVPRLNVVSIIYVDLEAPGVRCLVTPEASGGAYHLRARTTSEFLTDFDVQVATNGGFFSPWDYIDPQNYYPHTGDGVDSIGYTSSAGNVYNPYSSGLMPVYIAEDNDVQFFKPGGEIYNAISGMPILIAGRVPHLHEGSYVPHPRTAVATDREERVLMLFVVDGRRVSYSQGIALKELAALIRSYGGYHAINLDGGGSSTMVYEGEDGVPILLNIPVHASTPGMERPVATHIGIYAQPVGESP